MPSWLALSVTVFGAIFLLELPDKTAFATLLLATRHRPLPVFFGASAAFVVQTIVAVIAGSLFALLPTAAVRTAAALLFLGLAAMTLFMNRKQAEAREQDEVERVERRFRVPLFSGFMVVFVTEWGDLTQLATAAFQARYQQPVLVFSAAVLALWCVTAIAVVAGNRLGRMVPERPLQLAGAGVMAAIGLLLLSGRLG